MNDRNQGMQVKYVNYGAHFSVSLQTALVTESTGFEECVSGMIFHQDHVTPHN